VAHSSSCARSLAKQQQHHDAAQHAAGAHRARVPAAVCCRSATHQGRWPLSLTHLETKHGRLLISRVSGALGCRNPGHDQLLASSEAPHGRRQGRHGVRAAGRGVAVQRSAAAHRERHCVRYGLVSKDVPVSCRGLRVSRCFVGVDCGAMCEQSRQHKCRHAAHSRPSRAAESPDCVTCYFTQLCLTVVAGGDRTVCCRATHVANRHKHLQQRGAIPRCVE
jgi:hypothetical protein